MLCAEAAGSPWSSFRLHIGAWLQILGERGLTLVMKRLQRGRGHRESLPTPCPSSPLPCPPLCSLWPSRCFWCLLYRLSGPHTSLPSASHSPADTRISPLPVTFLMNGLQMCDMPWPSGIAPALPSHTSAALSAKSS